MNFQSIKHVEEAQWYLDLAFRRAREKGKQLRQTKLKGGRMEKSRYIELLKMQVISDTIASRMQSILTSFPSLDQLPPFYLELVKLHIDYVQFKKSLGALRWLEKRMGHMFRIYKSKMMKNTVFDRVSLLKGEYLGRLSSMVKQVKHDFTYLEQARRTMKAFPTVKTGLYTVAIAGFPNVGKSTLLGKLSGSHAEVNEYPFTTKGVNVAYIGKGKSRVQLLDTPGTLDRFEKMNYIERVAYLALEYCTQKVVYVFDPTEEYPLEKQEKLLKRLKKDFKLPIICYCSKIDIGDKEMVDTIVKKYKAYTDVEKLKTLITTDVPEVADSKE